MRYVSARMQLRRDGYENDGVRVTYVRIYAISFLSFCSLSRSLAPARVIAWSFSVALHASAILRYIKYKLQIVELRVNIDEH